MKAEFVIGFDQRELLGWRICVKSILAHSKFPYPIRPISIEHLDKFYDRPTCRRNGKLWDEISQAYCSTSFSLARFWTPVGSDTDWSIYMDGDFLIRHDIQELIDRLDDKYGVMCVKHSHNPEEIEKMDGQVQTTYPRKNWSSLMAFNNRHESTRRLIRGQPAWPNGNQIVGCNLNLSPGLVLQQFCWARDDEIGPIDPAWNWLDDGSEGNNPKAVHFTRGTPDMNVDSRYAKEWWSYS